MKKRVLSMVLAIALLAGNMPNAVFAAEVDELCEHHTAHTAECGYVEGETECSYHCDECLGHSHDEDVTVSDTTAATEETACQHSFTTEVNKVAATCKATGSVTMACACGETEVQTLEIDPQNHTGKKTVVGKTRANCGVDGYTGDTVCECGAKITTGESIPATGKHRYSNNTDDSCNTCGYTRRIVSNEEIMVDFNEDFQDDNIPAALKDAGFDTVEHIKNTLIETIEKENTNFKVADAMLCDATLMVTSEDGNSWTDADEHVFVKDTRILATMPLPEGTSSKTHKFAVARILSESTYTKNAGDVECPRVTVKTDDDGNDYLEFYVTAVSPVVVSWMEVETNKTATTKERTGLFNRNKSTEKTSWFSKSESTEPTGISKWFGKNESTESNNRFDKNESTETNNRFDKNESTGSDNRFDKNESTGSGNRFDKNESNGSDNRFDKNEPTESGNRFDKNESNGSGNRFDKNESTGSDNRFDKNEPTESGKHDKDGKDNWGVNCMKGQHKYESVVTEPTCERKGYTTHTCKYCYKSYKDSYTQPLGHRWNRGVETKKATCTRGGVKLFECRDCHKTRTEKVRPTGHNYKAVVTEPTCERGGFTTYTCRNCRDSYKDDRTKALGHEWNRGKVTKKPTCTKNGVKTFKCRYCDETRTEPVRATGHEFSHGKCWKCGKRTARHYMQTHWGKNKYGHK